MLKPSNFVVAGLCEYDDVAHNYARYVTCNRILGEGKGQDGAHRDPAIHSKKKNHDYY